MHLYQIKLRPISGSRFDVFGQIGLVQRLGVCLMILNQFWFNSTSGERIYLFRPNKV